MDDHERRRRAHEVVDRALERILAHDMPGFAALWAPEGTMEFPFAAPGSPTRLDGRDAVATYVAPYNDVVRPDEVVTERRHDTADPDTLVVEFTLGGRVVASGERYELGYVAVVTVGAAGIASYRDYWSPAATAAVFGAAGLAGAGA